MDNEPIMERVLHRLVSKHIAGTTMSSALERATEISGKGMGSSITFLSSAAMEKPKAAYITTTYLELIRRISRLGIGASVHVSLDQLGLGMGDDVALSNIGKIADLGSKSNVFVWAESRSHGRTLFKELAGMDIGIACGVEEAVAYLNGRKRARSIKLLIEEQKSEGRSVLPKELDGIIKRIEMPVLSSASEELLSRLIDARRNERNLIFEFRLGYSKRRLRKAQKRGARISVLVPFGKDWVNYATGKVSEGYMKFFAKRLFNERSGA